MTAVAVVALPLAVAAAVTLGALVLVRVGQGLAGRYRSSIGSIARDGLADAFIFIEPRRLLAGTMAVAAAVAALVSLGSGSSMAGIAAGAIALGAPRFVLARLTARRRRTLRSQLPDSLAALGAALRAGLGLSQALASLALDQPRPIADEFALIARKQRLGTPLDRAVAELGDRVPLAEFGLFCSAVRIAHEVGGSLAETLDRLADTVRRRIVLEEKIEALTAQGRLQGIVVGLLPVALVAVLVLLEPQAMQALFSTPLGWLTLAVVSVLELLGAYLIRRIVRIDV